MGLGGPPTLSIGWYRATFEPASLSTSETDIPGSMPCVTPLRRRGRVSALSLGPTKASYATFVSIFDVEQRRGDTASPSSSSTMCVCWGSVEGVGEDGLKMREWQKDESSALPRQFCKRPRCALVVPSRPVSSPFGTLLLPPLLSLNSPEYTPTFTSLALPFLQTNGENRTEASMNFLLPQALRNIGC
jgi:hypothetical protein